MPTVTVAWGEGDLRLVSSVNDLDGLLDELAIAGEPVLVEVRRNDGASLSLGVGRDHTVLDFVPPSLDPPYLAAVSHPPLVDETLWFELRGEESEFEPSRAIELDDGRRAVREFFATGELLQSLAWVEV